jgi:hypothetical protein
LDATSDFYYPLRLIFHCLPLSIRSRILSSRERRTIESFAIKTVCPVEPTESRAAEPPYCIIAHAPADAGGQLIRSVPDYSANLANIN